MLRSIRVLSVAYRGPSSRYPFPSPNVAHRRLSAEICQHCVNAHKLCQANLISAFRLGIEVELIGTVGFTSQEKITSFHPLTSEANLAFGGNWHLAIPVPLCHLGRQIVPSGVALLPRLRSLLDLWHKAVPIPARRAHH